LVLRTPLFYSSIYIVLFFIFLNCDSTNSPQPLEIDLPGFESTIVTPANITFTLAEDGYQDTTITFNIQANLNNQDSDFSVRYIATNQSSRSLISTNAMEQQGEFYAASFDLETSTTSITNLLIEVFIVNSNGDQTSAQIFREVVGFSNARPQMLEASNPTEVIIPTDDSTIIVPFVAKVTDADGQDNIDQVLIEFINEDGSVLVPSPNNVLLDNGLNEDVAAGDSLYTIAFTVNSSNTPNNRTAIYYAIDRAGLHSDTLSTTFNIVEGQ